MLVRMKTHLFLTPITVLFVTVLLVSNIASTKLTSFWGLTLDAGTILFPALYILGDILTEVYGFARTRRVIWLGFGASLLASLVFIIVGMLPAAPDWPNQEAYQTILGLTPRIVCASLIAYLVGEFVNSYILAKLKVRTAGRYLWFRLISSTLVGELLDSFMFITLAFAGLLPTSVLMALVVSNYLVKVAVEIACTPITYHVVAFLKQREEIDTYDRETVFKPFSLQNGEPGH